jgi:membrane peptidoglycan carboxypeptidase
MLEEVTRKGGTGTKAALADFRVAGKTGTAQKVDPVRGGYGDKRLASFLGFVPAEAPRLAIIVAIDEPEGKVYGGEVAAPAWGRIATEALRQLGVAPVSRQEEVALRDDQKKERDRQAAKAAALLAAKAAQQARAAQQAAEQASRQAASGAKEGKAAPVRPAAGPNPAAPAQPDLIKDSAKEAPAAVAGPVAEVGP